MVAIPGAMASASGDWYKIRGPMRYTPELFDWCSAHASSGRFAIQLFDDRSWWFEFEEDAMLFILRWCA